MIAALWIIAICEVIRVIQNGIQHMIYLYDIDTRQKIHNGIMDEVKATEIDFDKIKMPSDEEIERYKKKFHEMHPNAMTREEYERK